LFLFHLWIWSEVLVLIIEGYWYYTEYPNPTISFSFFHLRKLMKNETFSFPSVSLQKGRKSSSSSSHKINIKINKKSKNRFFSLGSVFFIKISKISQSTTKTWI
jgi:hypothetical protein